jgi:beta-phosphoglucomutase
MLSSLEEAKHTITKMIKAVIFDMDGVLADSHGIFNRLFTEIVRKELNLNISEEEFSRYPGIRFEQRIEKIAKLKGYKVSDQEIEKVIAKGRYIYYTDNLSFVKIYEGVKELLDILESNGLKIALGTNGSKRTVLKLIKNLDIEKYFSVIVTFDDVSAGKPFPDIFLRDAKEMDLSPKECVVVEDSIEGIDAAKAAGMKVIAVMTTQKKEELKNADLIVDSIKDINMEKIRKLA